MKKHSFLLLIAIFLYLFDTRCSEKSNINFFEILPTDMTERILLCSLKSVDDPIAAAISIQKVCRAWYNLVLQKEKTIAQFLKTYKQYKDRENKKFFDNYEAYISGYGDHDNPPDYTFFYRPLFDLTTALKYMAVAFDHFNFEVIEILIKKDDIILNDFLSDKKCVSSMINWDCVCVCTHIFDKCCVKQARPEPNQRAILEYILTKAPFISTKATQNIFDLFISDDTMAKFCMLRRLLPALEIQKADNGEYYFKSIVERISLLKDKFNEQKALDFRLEDNRLQQYLLILDKNNANFSLLNSQKDTYNERVANIIYFPSTKIILEDILKKQ